MKKLRLLSVILFTILSACNLSQSLSREVGTVTEEQGQSAAEETEKSLPTNTPIHPTLTNISTTEVPTSTYTPTTTYTLSPTESLTAALTETPTLTSTATYTPTIIPTYAVFRGKVLPDQVACKYGPGPMYLYKYALYGGSNLEVIGRIETNIYLLVQAIGGDNPCWINADYMELNGELTALEPVDPHIIMAWSPYYGPLTGVAGIRDGNTVTVSWNGIQLRPGDDSEQTPYVLEAWVCVERELVFTPVGTYMNAANIIDEPGCPEPSYGRVMAAEKHGYTPWVAVPWPQHNAAPSPTP